LKGSDYLNWFFYFLIILAAVVLWFLCSFVFKPLGKFCYRLYKDARDEIVDKDKTKENEKEI
jgi:uncharacterized protein involved in cysteine biosynthesis